MHAEIGADKRIILISDMHIGDGDRTEPFANKDSELRKFLDYAAAHADIFIIVGDGFDLAQAFSFERIYRNHKPLIDDLIALSRGMPVYYLEGNHEGSLESLRPALPFNYCRDLKIGEKILIEHGHRFDGRNQPGDRHAFLGARLHSTLEKIIRTPVRIPMRKHYYWSTRLGHWIFYRYGYYRLAKAKFYRLLGNQEKSEHNLGFLQYWGGGEWGDNHGILQPAEKFLDESPIETLVCGHSHQAGKVRFDGGNYLNAGSWVYQDANYVFYNQGDFEIRDWVSGKVLADEQYRGILGPHRNKSFFDWWKVFYRGWFRYDIEAMNRAALGENPFINP